MYQKHHSTSEEISPKVLIAADVPANLEILRKILEPEGLEILAASNKEAVLEAAFAALPDIILLNVMTSRMDIYDVYCRLKRNPSTVHIPVMFVNAAGKPERIVKGLCSNGLDCISIRPINKERLLALVQSYLKVSRLMRKLRQKSRKFQQDIEKREQADYARQDDCEGLYLISKQEAKRWGIDAFMGKSKIIKGVLDEVRRLQTTSRTSVLITGESGAGKELIARAIHFGSERAKGPFVPVNCSAVPRELAESAFFGHVRGAFTGANEDRNGYFELAHGGTLLLDEIGDMPIQLQPKILRIIEDGYVMPVGGTRQRHADVRIIASTNQDLLKKTAAGAFREELYFRLERFTLRVPPLRERKEDISPLAEHFLRMLSSEMDIPLLTFSSEALKTLESYYFPGNVRELKNIVECALLRSSGEPVIKPEHLQLIDSSVLRDIHTDLADTPQADQNPSYLEHTEKLVIRRAQKPADGQEEEATVSPMTDEERILAYVREHGSTNNAECREFLSIDRRRATYLLHKLCRYGLLIRQGDRRWARYSPA